MASARSSVGWRWRWLLSSAGSAMLIGVSCAPPPPEEEVLTTAIVERVVDGDTVELSIGGSSERVRLLGIDAPESVARNVPEQCYGAEASASLAALLPVGAEVAISRDLEARDRYGRLLLYLHDAETGTFINHWLVDSGLADATSYEPNVAHRTDFEIAEREARTEGRGLWAACDGPDQPLE